MSLPLSNDTAAVSRNLELKAQIPPEALDTMRETLRDTAAHGPAVERQEDRYFTVPEGRLKLRTISTDDGASRAELIAYRRPDEARSRWSAYRITPMAVDQAASLAGTLAQVLPVLVVVRKRREIYLSGATRIHLDDVEGLGTFVELETVVTTQAEDAAAREHRAVVEMLGLERWPSQAGSYSDLLLRKDATDALENHKQGTCIDE